MSRTKLYAVQRMIRNKDKEGGFDYRYLVYRPTDNPQGATWTKSIAKASRWQNRHDAEKYRDEVIKAYRITDAALIVEA